MNADLPKETLNPLKQPSFAAVECSLQHVFAGDSEGTLHMYNAELAPKGQLHRLMWLTKRAELDPKCQLHHLVWRTKASVADIVDENDDADDDESEDAVLGPPDVADQGDRK
eukprot:1158928-Pelagomonas_calceolata.AAC.5